MDATSQKPTAERTAEQTSIRATTQPSRGWALYDRDCSVCQAWTARVGPPLMEKGFAFDHLQAPWVKERLGLPEEKLLEEMKVITADGEILGGADGMVYLARWVWWTWPLYGLSLIPGMKPIIRWGYRRFAANRHRFGGKCKTKKD